MSVGGGRKQGPGICCILSLIPPAPRQLTWDKDSALLRLVCFSGSFLVFPCVLPHLPQQTGSSQDVLINSTFAVFQREAENPGLSWLGVSPEEMLEDRPEERGLAY